MKQLSGQAPPLPAAQPPPPLPKEEKPPAPPASINSYSTYSTTTAVSNLYLKLTHLVLQMNIFKSLEFS